MEPFGWKRGSVRAVITIILAAGAIPVAVWAPDAGQTFYAAIATLAVRDYFSHRAQQNRVDGPTPPHEPEVG